jgi:hypothetical protein
MPGAKTMSSPDARARDRAAKYEQWKAARDAKPTEACSCGLRRFDPDALPLDMARDSLGHAWCAPCYAITPYGQSEIADLIIALAED